MIWGGADIIIIEIKCTINVNKWSALESSWSHCLSPSMEKLSSMKPVPGAKGVGAHCSRGLNHHTSSCTSLLSHVWLSMTPRTVARQAPLSMGFSGKNTGVGCRALLQRIFPTWELNPYLLCLLHHRQALYPLSHLGSLPPAQTLPLKLC